MVHKSSYCCVY